MSRTSSIILTTTLLAGHFFTSSLTEKKREPHFYRNPNASPNIIFIIADDMGWDVFGKYPGANGVKANTPTLDSMARSGITFTNFWVNPVCSPTRASLLTGKYNFRTGVGGTNPTNSILRDNEILIQKYISDKTGNNYANAVIGKWHVSGADAKAPENFGIQYYSGMLRGGVGGGGQNYYRWNQTSGGSQQRITTYTSTHLVNQSILWISKQAKPFFLWLAFNAPHAPFHRPPLDLISNKSLPDSPDTISARPFPYYLAAIEAMDKEIGRLIASLTPAQKENTVFVFMGDNGTTNFVAQAPYPTGHSKQTLFQGGINTPLIVCGKNVSRKNVLEPSLVQAQDMFATFAQIAGTGISKYEDGVSIVPAFTKPNALTRNFAYSEQFGQDPTREAPDGNQLGNPNGYAIRNMHYKFIHLETGEEYLFNLTTDPFEKTNLLATALSIEAKKNLEQLKKLKERLK